MSLRNVQQRLVHITAAEPGYRTLIQGDDGTIHPDEAVIAWRFETLVFDLYADEDSITDCMPLTVDGGMVANCVGVLHPDKTVTLFHDGTFASLEALYRQCANTRPREEAPDDVNTP